jgi:rhodanese-related sulfurtransferase
MKKRILVVLGAMLMAIFMLAGCSSPSEAGSETKDRAKEDIAWQFKTADEVKELIETNADVLYLDIQPEEDYNKGHLPNTIASYAYPVDSEELENKVRDSVAELKNSEAPIVVICPGGGSGAKRTISVLIEEGIDASRLFILEDGAKGWPYADMLVAE